MTWNPKEKKDIIDTLKDLIKRVKEDRVENFSLDYYPKNENCTGFSISGNVVKKK
jgi:hypothetical protein